MGDHHNVVDAHPEVHHVAVMSQDRRTAAQLPFWPGVASPAPTRAERSEVKKGAKVETPAERAVRQRLQQRLGAKVVLNDKRGRGSFTVRYTSYDELDEIMRRIKA
jgi:hypothetical protein